MPKTPEVVIPTFTENEVAKLLSQPNLKTNAGYRDYCILLTLIDTAVRLSGLANLKTEDIDFEQNLFRVMGKGQHDGRPLLAKRIEKLVSSYGKKAGLKRCYAHKLRHTSSVMYLRNGGDVFSLQKKLGHRSLVMTRHYANLADSDVRAQHKRYGVADRLNI